MIAREIRNGIYGISVNDRTTDLFEGLWPIEKEGVTYNSYIIDDEKKVLVDLIKGLDPDLDPVTSLVDEAALLLESMPPTADRFDELAIRKRRLFRAAQQADTFHQKLERQNMETLMLQGHPIPTMSAEEARRGMRRIDQICRAVFGRTPFIEPPDTTADAPVLDPVPPAPPIAGEGDGA